MTEKDGGDARLEIQGVGEGAVWVCEANGNFENGDYITTCEVPGYGARQHDDILHSYTLGKITTDVDWDTVEDLIPLRIIETYTSNIEIQYTYTCNIETSYEEFDSNLGCNVELTSNMESNITVAEIVEKTFNRLDSDGYAIYTDLRDAESNIVYDTALNLRYVREDGTVIDRDTYEIEFSSNLSVYRCAFVGCSYCSS